MAFFFFSKINLFFVFDFRLYSKGTVLGYRRSQRDQDPNNTLIEIEGVKSQEAARFYLGKRIAYVYPVKRPVQGKNFRVVWGR